MAMLYILLAILLIVPLTLHNSPVECVFMRRDDHTIFFYTNGQTGDYKSTIAACASVGGSLPSIHGEEDVDFLVALAGPDRAASVWLGANKINDKTFEWSDGSIFDYADWSTSQPDCPTFVCSLVLVCRQSQTDHRKMKAEPIMNQHRQVCRIDLSNDAAVEQAYLATMRNESGVMRDQDADQLVRILFNDDIGDVRTLVRRIKLLRRVSADVVVAKGAAAVSLLLSLLLAFIVLYVYKVQNSYLHNRHVQVVSRNVTD